MKAYEFYVLLGKYKRKSLSRSEYDRFCSAIATVRGFRSTFHESTGESYPVFAKSKIPRPHKTRSEGNSATGSGREDRTLLHPSQARQNQSRSSLRPAAELPPLRPDANGMESHRVFKRVRRQPRRRFRAVRLLRDVLLHHPFLIFLTILLLIAIGLILALLVRREPSFLPVPPANPMDPMNTAGFAAGELSTSTLNGGPPQSEAGALSNGNSDTFRWESDPLEPIAVPITGLEQAILEGLEARFPDPATALGSTIPSPPTVPASTREPDPPAPGP